MNEFPTKYADIIDRVRQIDPMAYGKTRNFADGAVTRLSPYMSRGVISTKMVMEDILDRGYAPHSVKKLLQELAWRDYFQQVWNTKGAEIDKDVKNRQPDVLHHEMPMSIYDASTGIEAVDEAIQSFYNTGYMHNHMRMYVAMLACNIGRSHWSTPARWLYYHLLDGDWASNALSWQWVAGAFSNKKYIANQENVNKYFYSQQRKTFIDVSYESLSALNLPKELSETIAPELKTTLPETSQPTLNRDLPVLIYNLYNLDPLWKKDIAANRILLLEPSVFEKYPVSDQTLSFVKQLADNIDGITMFSGEFYELKAFCEDYTFYYKQHPLNTQYTGIEEPRAFMFDVSGFYPSFFKFWKQCEKMYPFK